MIDKSKQYVTNDGHAVRIYATDAGGNFPVHGAIFIGGSWDSTTWTTEGKLRDEYVTTSFDLKEVRSRIKQTVWVVVGNDDATYLCRNPDALQHYSKDLFKACQRVEIDIEEGQYDDC